MHPSLTKPLKELLLNKELANFCTKVANGFSSPTTVSSVNTYFESQYGQYNVQLVSNPILMPYFLFSGMIITKHDTFFTNLDLFQVERYRPTSYQISFLCMQAFIQHMVADAYEADKLILNYFKTKQLRIYIQEIIDIFEKAIIDHDNTNLSMHLKMRLDKIKQFDLL